MGHKAPPPRPADIARVEEWVDKMCSVLENAPSQLGLDFHHQKNQDTTEEYPLHAFVADHHTLPARQLVIGVGIPSHGKKCKCIEPSKPQVAIYVVDTDTGESVPDCGELEFKDPAEFSMVMALAMCASAAFSQTGVL